MDGIAYTSEFVWVSHTRYIYFLNPDNLALEGSVSRDEERDAFIGQLSASPEENVIWSAHLGGVILTAWDANNCIHSFDIDTCEVLTQSISDQISKHDAVLTAMLPALDTVWVGMATGHIMIFHKEQLLTWFQPYTEYVRFLSIVSSSGPCEMEKCMVVSGGKGFIPLVDDMGPDYKKKDEMDQPLDKAGVLVVWEAFEAKTLRQVRLVEEGAPGFLDNHYNVRQMIQNGDFKDGTYINKPVDGSDGGDRVFHQHMDAQLNVDWNLSASLYLIRLLLDPTPSPWIDSSTICFTRTWMPSSIRIGISPLPYLSRLLLDPIPLPWADVLRPMSNLTASEQTQRTSLRLARRN